MGARGRVLVVDDDRDFRESVALVLEQAGYFVIEATGGRHALDLVDRVNPDLVLVDVTMPEMSGLELVRQLRQKAEQKGDERVFGVVAMSGAVQAGHSPTEWFLMKPVRADLLLAVVARFCGQGEGSPFWRGEPPRGVAPRARV